MTKRATFVELGNETQTFLGAMPFVDPALQYKQHCHGYVGAKLADSSIIVVSAGAAGTRTLSGNTMTMEAYWSRLLDHAVGTSYVSAGYFQRLCAAHGISKPVCPDVPADAIGLHTYTDDPIKTPNPLMSAVAQVFNDVKNRGGGGYLPIMLTEQGPDWERDGYGGGATANRNARYSFEWVFDFLNLQWGNIRWPWTPDINGLGSTTATLAERRVIAAATFMPPVIQWLKDTTAQHVGLWDGSNSPKFYPESLLGLSTTIASASNGDTLPQATINVVNSLSSWRNSGYLLIGAATAGAFRNWHVHYTGTATSPNRFTGCTIVSGRSGSGGVLATGMKVTPANDMMDALVWAPG